VSLLFNEFKALTDLIKNESSSSYNDANRDEITTLEEEIFKLDMNSNQIKLGFNLLLNPDFIKIMNTFLPEYNKSFFCKYF
jgi:hypothetical protein